MTHRYPAVLGATLLLVLVAAPGSALAPSSAGHEGHGQGGAGRTSSPSPAVSPSPDVSDDRSNVPGHDMEGHDMASMGDHDMGNVHEMGGMQMAGGEAEPTTRGPVLAGFALVNVATLGTAFVLKRRSARRRRDPQPRESGEHRRQPVGR